jgi:putative addiction module component (TIGR02574 family)
MSPEVSDLLKRALALPVEERAALANTLLDSLEVTNESVPESVEEAWDQEVARRIEDLKTGKAVTVPWEQLHRELLAMVNER